MNAKYTFFIGLNDKDTKTQIISTVDAYHIIENVFAANGTDCTITGGRGVYTHESGQIVTEETLCVTVFEFGDKVPVKSICDNLKSALNQESIAVERAETESALY